MKTLPQVARQFMAEENQFARVFTNRLRELEGTKVLAECALDVARAVTVRTNNWRKAYDVSFMGVGKVTEQVMLTPLKLPDAFMTDELRQAFASYMNAVNEYNRSLQRLLRLN